MKNIETIMQNLYKEFCGNEAEGTPTYVEPDAAKNLAKAEVLAEFIKSQPEYKDTKVVITKSPTDLVNTWKASKEAKPLHSYNPLLGIWCAHVDMANRAAVEAGEGTPEILEAIELYKKTGNCTFVIEGQEAIYIVQLPTKHFCQDTPNGVRAHNDKEFALQFVDGTGICMIEDITCPDWFITKPKSEVTAEDVLNLEDTDHRRIALQRYGIMPIIEKAEVIEDNGEYQLIDLGKAIRLEKALYLKMVNPSTQETLVLGVSNDCQTVADAIKMRAGGVEWNPRWIDSLCRDGGNESQRQQGDVLIQEITEEAFAEAIVNLSKVERDFVLSPLNQRRHIVSEGVEIFGNDELQFIKAPEQATLNHPEHGPVSLFSYQKVWAVVERDHVRGLTRTEID